MIMLERAAAPAVKTWYEGMINHLIEQNPSLEIKKHEQAATRKQDTAVTKAKERASDKNSNDKHNTETKSMEDSDTADANDGKVGKQTSEPPDIAPSEREENNNAESTPQADCDVRPWAQQLKKKSSATATTTTPLIGE